MDKEELERKLTTIIVKLDVKGKEEKLAKLKEKTQNQDFWQDYQAAARLGNPRAQGILMARKIAW